ncbi:hypothetical protein PUN28_008819 [Cardiocondyla obscurior]|uniref:Uncharacterized protein n=1 Tax=Cardiocondyla obscurior TaxID=286306 RepID=A0AAW2FSE4_9HYME
MLGKRSFVVSAISSFGHLPKILRERSLKLYPNNLPSVKIFLVWYVKTLCELLPHKIAVRFVEIFNNLVFGMFACNALVELCHYTTLFANFVLNAPR